MRPRSTRKLPAKPPPSSSARYRLGAIPLPSGVNSSVSSSSSLDPSPRSVKPMPLCLTASWAARHPGWETGRHPRLQRARQHLVGYLRHGLHRPRRHWRSPSSRPDPAASTSRPCRDGRGRPQAYGTQQASRSRSRYLSDKAGQPATARHRFGAVSRLYKWLISVDALEIDPSAAAKPPAPPAPRSSVTGAKTVKSLWDTAERLPATRSAFTKLSLLLPLRRQELADLKIRSIVLDGGGAEIRLAASETKNRKPFVLPLTGTALEIVQGLLLLRGGQPDDFLIPLAKRGGAFADWGGLAKQIARAGDGLRFQWHDTRRMFASEMAEHGVGQFRNHRWASEPSTQRIADRRGALIPPWRRESRPAGGDGRMGRILLHAARTTVCGRARCAPPANVIALVKRGGAMSVQAGGPQRHLAACSKSWSAPPAPGGWGG